MYLEQVLKEYDGNSIKLFVDMDGVIADFDFGNYIPFDQKRPLFDSIRKLEIISHMPNVELYIFSATSKPKGVEQKNWWLDKYAPFFKQENRIIIFKDSSNKESTSIVKAKYLQNFERDNSIIMLIDDDPKNLYEIYKLNNDIIPLKDTVLVDDTIEKQEKLINELLRILENDYPDKDLNSVKVLAKSLKENK